MQRPGKIKRGYKDKYEASPIVKRNDRERPLEAFESDRSVNVFVMTEVVRAKQAAIVKGLNKNLRNTTSVSDMEFERIFIPSGNCNGSVLDILTRRSIERC